MRVSVRHRLLISAYIILIAGETVWLFADRSVPFSIDGRTPFVIDTFGAGSHVEHGFLMTGDGLAGISVRFAADHPMRIRVLSVLSVADERVPEAHAELYRWVSPVTLEPGLQWKRFDFLEVTRSNDRFFTFEIRLVDGALLDETGGQTRERLPVAVMASHDNPPRGGILRIDGVRQIGSLQLRAHGPRESPYEQFRHSVEPRLPPLLRNHAIQIAIGIVYQWALFVFADALLFGETANVRQRA